MSKIAMITLALTGLLSSYTVVAASLGEKVANQGSKGGAMPCSGCHGTDGMGSSDNGFPKLAGLNQAYIEKQIYDFRNGTRNNPLMQGMVAALNDDEIKAVSVYLSQLPAKPLPGERDPELLAQGEQIATRGLWHKEVPACSRCHAPSGKGIGKNFPALAGQHATYIEAQIAAWKSGERSNDPNELMSTVAKRLTEQETKAVAAYYSRLQPEK